MDFGEALKAAKTGRPVRRVGWPEDVAVYATNVVTAKSEGTPALVIGRPWKFDGADLLAEDWVVAEEK